MPNKIFVVDEAVTGDDLQFVTRAALPQTISGLLAGDYTILNTSVQGVATVTAAAGSVAILQEMTPTTYTGPTLTGTLPAAVGGFRTFTAGDPAAMSAPLALTPEAYVIMRVRRPTGASGTINVLSFNTGNYGNNPWFDIRANMYSSRWYITAHKALADTYTSLESSGLLTDQWTVVEAWMDGTDVYLSLNGGAPATVALTGAGDITTDTLYMFRDEGSGGQTVEVVGWRVYDGVPDATGRANARSWINAFTL